MNPENETALAIDFKSDKICVWELKKIWKRSRDTSEKIITYKYLKLNLGN